MNTVQNLSSTPFPEKWLSVIGIGEEGWSGLGAESRSRIRQAPAIFGSPRHLGMLPGSASEFEASEDRRFTWSRRMEEDFPRLREQGPGTVVLATGDPLCYGVGAKLLREGFRIEEIRFLPSPSAYSLACGRLGWSLPEVETLTVHGRPHETLHPFVQPGVRMLILSWNEHSPGQVARLLEDRGFGPSRITVLEHLGGERERLFSREARGWSEPAGAALNVVAVECFPGPEAQLLPRVPGLPDEAFEHDGQISKREVRAMTLAQLMPIPGQRLWDLGAGCGSVAVEWLRSDPRNTAVAVERHPERLQLLERNAVALGVRPRLEIVEGHLPQVLPELPAPHAVFVGGGISTEVLSHAWRVLPVHGRLVANAVTLESERTLLDWQARHGGELRRIAISRAEPVGPYLGWRGLMPVTQLSQLRQLVTPANAGIQSPGNR